MFVDHGLKHVRIHVLLVHDDSVMGGASRALDCRVRVQVKVITKRLSDVAVDQGARDGITVLITSQTLVREEADMVALLSNNDSKVDLNSISKASNRNRSQLTL